MIKNRVFTAYITETRVGSANLTFSGGRDKLLKQAIENSAIDKIVVVLVEDNTHIVEEVPAAYFNQLLWHELQGRPAIDMTKVPAKMRTV